MNIYIYAYMCTLKTKKTSCVQTRETHACKPKSNYLHKSGCILSLDKPMGKGAGYKAWYPTIIDQSALRIQADCATEDFILAKLPANIPSGLQKKLEADPQWGVLATRLEKLYGTQESGVVDPSGFVCLRRLKGPLEASHDPGIEFHVGHNPSQVLDSGWVMPDMKSFMPVDDARQFNEVGSQ